MIAVEVCVDDQYTRQCCDRPEQSRHLGRRPQALRRVDDDDAIITDNHSHRTEGEVDGVIYLVRGGIVGYLCMRKYLGMLIAIFVIFFLREDMSV